MLSLMLQLVPTLWQPSETNIANAVELKMRVMPWHCDPNMHINNGKYLSIMDLGRGQLFVRHGLMKKIMRHKFKVVVGAAHILYRRSIPIGRRFTLRSQFIGVNERFIVLQQGFIYGTQIAALAYVNVAFSANSGLVTPSDVCAALEIDFHALPVLPEVGHKAWETDKALLERMSELNLESIG
ncbi:MAG TPA: hypothetical protein DCZ03_05890 [Gammaproteobacteria bacterium]|nr:hypothetical protein [Gammaproteobacteria bacterium]